MKKNYLFKKNIFWDEKKILFLTTKIQKNFFKKKNIMCIIDLTDN